jgi:hypothetical protein
MARYEPMLETVMSKVPRIANYELPATDDFTKVFELLAKDTGSVEKPHESVRTTAKVLCEKNY